MTFVAAPDAVRMWTTYREAGRPIPRFSDDEYIDYCVIEAIGLRVKKEENKARKDYERKQEVDAARRRLVKQHG